MWSHGPPRKLGGMFPQELNLNNPNLLLMAPGGPKMLELTTNKVPSINTISNLILSNIRNTAVHISGITANIKASAGFHFGLGGG